MGASTADLLEPSSAGDASCASTPGEPPSLAGFAWFSSAALLAVVFLSVYAAAFPPAFPPAFPDDARRRAPIASVARYDFSDFVNAAR